MDKPQIRKHIKSIYQLLSLEDNKPALKIAFELLLHTASLDLETRQSEFEKKPLSEILEMLFKFLSKNENMYKRIEYFFDDLICLAVYYDKLNREYETKYFSSRINLLVTKILGIIEWYLQDRKDGYYTIDNFDNRLLDAEMIFIDESSVSKVTILSCYYYIETRFFGIYKISFWKNEKDKLRFVSDEVIDWLDNLQLGLEENNYNNLSISDYEVSDVYENYILKNRNLEFIIGEINKFKKTDEVVHKRIYQEINSYKEASFHKHLFSFFAKDKTNNEILLSELPFNNNRYDIYWHNVVKNFSAIIELKVNDLKEVLDNIEQIKDYIKRVNEIIFYRKPQVGVLCIYNSGDNQIDYIKEKLDKKYIVYKDLEDCLYLEYENVVITLIG